MNLRFKQCNFCPQKERCEFRDKLRAEVRNAGMGITAVINCPEYRKLFKEGDRVQFSIFDREYAEFHHVAGGEDCIESILTWVEHDAPYIGTITGKLSGDKLFEIALDAPVKVRREDRPFVEEERTNYYKPANQLIRTEEIS